jgi:hypothetical protein
MCQMPRKRCGKQLKWLSGKHASNCPSWSRQIAGQTADCQIAAMTRQSSCIVRNSFTATPRLGHVKRASMGMQFGGFFPGPNSNPVVYLMLSSLCLLLSSLYLLLSAQLPSCCCRRTAALLLLLRLCLLLLMLLCSCLLLCLPPTACSYACSYSCFPIILLLHAPTAAASCF